MKAIRVGPLVVCLVLAHGVIASSPAWAKPVPRPPVDYTLTLGGERFDPLVASPALAPGWDRSAADGADLRLVQLWEVPRDEALVALRARGLEIVQYLYPHTYIVWGAPSGLADAARDPLVRWAGDFAPAFRVAPATRALDAQPVVARALLYRGAGVDTTLAALAQAGALITGHRPIDARFEVARFSTPGDRLEAIARVRGVYAVHLEPTDGGLRGEMSAQIAADNVDGSNLAFPGYTAWLSSVGVDGDGVIIANVDGGVNQSHPDLINRFLPCSGSTCSTTQSSHGTHTAGIMAGDGSSGTLDAFGFLRGLGVAPGAQLFEQVYSPTFTQDGGMLLLMTQSWQNGAQLSGNSWGPAGTPRGYDDDTLQVDIGVRDADPGLAGNQPLSYVLSFMNGDGGTQSQGTPDEGKNIFTIGSTKAQSGTGAQILEIDDLSANTAHGPALDGRTIPHMVAPGCSVDSTDTAAGGYGRKCGTSMASPHVAGALALFIEKWRARPDYVADPSPALLKAAFLAVARSLAGNLDADGAQLSHPFDSKQGWGRMNLPAAIDPPEFGVQYFDQETTFDSTGEEWVRSFSPLDPNLPVRMMLVWTDAPGHGLGGTTPAWNNDLDLVVEAGGDLYLGNQFGTNGFSVTGGVADIRNNTEGVFLGPVPPGSFNVRVVASNINSDGVPNSGDATDQDFAFVCYNCAAEPGFALTATVGHREVCAPATATYPIDVVSILGFTDPVDLDVAGTPAGATASFAPNPVTPGGSTTLTVDDTAGSPDGEYQLTIEGTSGTLSRTTSVHLTLFTATPFGVAALAPADGAIDVSLNPELTWSAGSQVSSYTLDVAADPAFATIVHSDTLTDTTTMVGALDPFTTYWWRVRGDNACGVGVSSPAVSFTTRAVPPLLLVDDDDNSPDVRASYVAALDALGVAYDIWDTNNSDVEPTDAELAPYEQVIWFTGDEYGGFAGPGSAGETALGSWLERSRCLLLSSQDYHYDRTLTGFMQDYLGVSSVTNDIAQTSLTGVGSIFGALGSYTPVYPYTNYTDSVVASPLAENGFSGSSGVAAVTLDGGVWRTAFLAFGVEAVPTATDREELLAAFFGWCGDLALADGDGDGTSNGMDCAPGDGSVWMAPTPAGDLILTQLATDNLSWSAPSSPGATSLTYDVLRAAGATDFASASCTASEIAATTATDSEDPAPDSGFYYLVRARNACGETMGSDSFGSARPGATCP